MENLNLDPMTLGIIGGAVLVLLLALVVIIRKRRKKGPGSSPSKKSKAKEKHIVVKDFEVVEVSETEIASAPRIELEKFDDGVRSLSFRFRVKGSALQVDEIDPVDNHWAKVHDYNEIVGQNRSSDQVLHLYMDRKERKRPSKRESAVISIVYKEANGAKWMQQINYSSDTGARLGELKKLK